MLLSIPPPKNKRYRPSWQGKKKKDVDGMDRSFRLPPLSLPYGSKEGSVALMLQHFDRAFGQRGACALKCLEAG
jgi:hypothetical protein